MLTIAVYATVTTDMTGIVAAIRTPVAATHIKMCLANMTNSSPSKYLFTQQTWCT